MALLSLFSMTNKMPLYIYMAMEGFSYSMPMTNFSEVQTPQDSYEARAHQRLCCQSRGGIPAR